MEQVFKHKWIFLAVAIVLLYFFLRIPNLTLQPIFADEAIYIRWAQVMRAEPTLRFLPLSDGKTPLFMWSIMPLFKIFTDPLFAGRFLSVVSGFATLIGIFALAWKIFNLRTAILTAFIYAIVPYTVFFDRMALVDSMLSAFGVWAIFFAIWLVELPRLDKSMILGFLFGGALLVKTPAMFNLLVLPLSGLVFKYKTSRKKLFFKMLLYWVVAMLIALAIYNLLRLGPNFQLLSSRNQDYVFSLQDLLKRPLDPFVPHLGDVRVWFEKLITFPLWVFIFIGVFGAFKKINKVAIVVLAWVLIPALIQIAMLKTFTARYLLFSISPLLIFAGFGIDYFSASIKTFKKFVLAVVILAVSFNPLYTDFLIVTNPQMANLPSNERRGYLEDWTAGYNFKTIALFLLEQKKNGPVVVGTEGYFGTLPDGLQIYLDKSEIPVIGAGDTISAKIREAAKDNLTYYVANEARVGKNILDAKLIMRFEKAKPKIPQYKEDAIVVYQVFPDGN